MRFSTIIQNHKTAILSKLTGHQQKILSTIENCRTPALGSHLYRCNDCNSLVLLHNSCSNRNCPVCQGNKRQRWIQGQCANLLNVPYFHVVFTLPHVLNPLFLQHPVVCYNALFHATWNTLKAFFSSETLLQGKGGMFCILHTWGQNLAFHPHLHCLVPAAGIGNDGDFKLLKGKDKFLFNVKAMSKVFRAKFAEELTVLEKKQVLVIPPITRGLMFAKKWVVFSQRPFSTPQNVVRYIGMYSHRVAISENRIIDDSDGKISMHYKDYKNAGEKKILQLESEEFLRRFAMHILPHKFVKIRYYGQLNNRNKKHFLELGTQQVGKFTQAVAENDPAVSQTDAEPDFGLDDSRTQSKVIRLIHCPYCKTGTLRLIASLARYGVDVEILVVDSATAEIICRSKDPPPDGKTMVMEIAF